MVSGQTGSKMDEDAYDSSKVVNLVEKYGVCPQSLYPESYNSSNSGRLNSLLTSKVDNVIFFLCT